MAMDTNHFVLSVAVFMVIVTVMITFSQWEYRPELQPQRQIQCRFAKACRGADCSVPLPGDIVILPRAEDGAAYYHDATDAAPRHALETVNDHEWVRREGKTGMMRIQLADNGALTATHTQGLGTDSTVLETATGFCVDMGETGQEQG